MRVDARAAPIIRRLHRLNAFLLGSFLLFHFANHLAVVSGIEVHLRIQEALRRAYRLPVIEPVIIGLFLCQIALGIVLLVQRGAPKGPWAWAQAASGAYLALFIVQHLAAILAARMGSPGLDTNSWFAAAVVSRVPFVWYFAPYYVLGVTAVFTHVACALRFRTWPARATPFEKVLPIVGLLVGCVAVAGLMAATHVAELPAEYGRYLDGLLP